MAVIFTTNKNYIDIDAYEHVIKYAANLSKCQGYIGGSCSNLYEPISAIKHMKDVYKTYKSMHDKDVSKLCHFIISFPPYVTGDKDYEIISFLRSLCSIIGKEYQCFWGLHIFNPKPNSNDATHIHFIVNRISYINGKYLSNSQVMAIKNLMYKLLEDYDIEEIQ